MDTSVLGFIAVTQEEAFILMIGLIVVFVDMILLLAEGNQLDNKNFNAIIKGEH